MFLAKWGPSVRAWARSILEEGASAVLMALMVFGGLLLAIPLVMGRADRLSRYIGGAQVPSYGPCRGCDS